jgi:hypothetical protein
MWAGGEALGRFWFMSYKDKRPLERPGRKFEDTIKIHLREIGMDGTNWIRLAEDRVHWRNFLNTEVILRFPNRKRGVFS